MFFKENVPFSGSMGRSMTMSDISLTIDLRQVGRGLNIPLRQVQATVELLDEGNTVPFITRYRKDQTGGLDEEQIREIQSRLNKARLLADRKQTILRSIESQGKLTEELAKRVLAAATTKRLEDLYLPFKPKKLSLATLARSRGLEPLAEEIFGASPNSKNLDARAADFVNVDRQVPTAADALLGAGHIIAERIGEMAELRQKLREVLQRSGTLVCSRIQTESKPAEEKSLPGKTPAENPPTEEKIATVEPAAEQSAIEQPAMKKTAAEEPTTEGQVERPLAEQSQSEHAPVEQPMAEQPAADQQATEQSSVEQQAAEQPTAEQSAVEQPAAAVDAPSEAPVDATTAAPDNAKAEPPKPPAAVTRKLARKLAKEAAKKKREQQKKKLEEKRIKEFSDYFNYRESTRRIPPHRVLAINRGERAKILRVRIESDLQAMVNIVEEEAVPSDHPHADYMRGCARDALGRLILPSLEREMRRELTDRAESHAVSVFARNLRNLLLQPPVHDQRVLAADPGFRSGCKLAVLDQFGNLLDHAVIRLVGKPDRTEEARKTVLDLIDRHQLTLVVIGNGTACRQTEEFFARLIEGDLRDKGIAYVIVNEAGASVYSTSRLGREEFPGFDAVLRGAISIGRRLQDPLSELVKIDPASIGVGLYQHDVKAKHLRASLDEVVESCVNFVGVNVNTASPALLRYVSGLNQLTARRLCEYRRAQGPFRSRRQLREVPGFGEATFVQAAGFLKIPRGDDPLDATWIHPESYAAANRAVAELLGAENDLEKIDLEKKDTIAALAEPIANVDLASLAKKLDVGELTLRDILSQLARPGRDPREDLPKPIFKRGVLKLEDLAPGMELNGTVLNVVDFGCFIDIGMHHSGLVHVSRLADKYVNDPHDVVAVGDIVKVWVLGIDKERQRVSLTMVQPGTERSRTQRRGGQGQHRKDSPEGGPRQPKPESGGRAARSGSATERRGRRERGRRDSRQHRSSQQRANYRPHRPPRPLPPISEEMKTGKAPMRTFGDLLQFYKINADENDPADAKPGISTDAKQQKPAAADQKTSVNVEQPAPAADHDEAPPQGVSKDVPASESPTIEQKTVEQNSTANETAKTEGDAPQPRPDESDKSNDTGQQP